MCAPVARRPGEIEWLFLTETQAITLQATLGEQFVTATNESFLRTKHAKQRESRTQLSAPLKAPSLGRQNSSNPLRSNIVTCFMLPAQSWDKWYLCLGHV